MSLPQWRGLWDWSMKYMDGTTPSNFNPEDVDPAKMQWLEEALKHYMVDFAARMQEIKDKLQSDTRLRPQHAEQGAVEGAQEPEQRGQERDQGGAGDEGEAAAADLEEREALLDELNDIVSSIDFAKDLHKIGGLPVLLELLESPHASLRWRAAEVVATCVANNPPVQEWFLSGGVLPRLLSLAAAPQPPAVRAKALLALSGLVRHNAPGLQALREAGGLSAVVSCLHCPDRRVSRKAMTTLAYMLSQRREDCVAAWREGAGRPLAAALQLPAAGSPGLHEEGPAGSAEDSDFRQAALGALVQLVGHPQVWAELHRPAGEGSVVSGGGGAQAADADTSSLQLLVSRVLAAHGALAEEEREARAEEQALLLQLQGLLAAVAAPEARPDGSDNITAAQFEEGERGEITINVKQPRAGGDAGSGAGDQGAAHPTGGSTATAAGAREQGRGVSANALGPPLLLGAP